MWALLLSTALAGPNLALEANANLGVPLSPLGIAPGLRVLFEGEITDGIWLGGEGMVRAPGSTALELNGPNLADTIDGRTGQTALAIGGRFDWIPSPDADITPRLGVALGAARVIQGHRIGPEPSREAVSSLWLKPEGGALFAVGPGYLSAGLFASILPTRLDTLGAGGSDVGLSVGWRQPLN